MVDLEQILYRIINGYYTINIDDTIYKIVLPTIDIKQKAHSLYLDIIEDNKFDSSWISQSTINNLLKVYNIWNEELEKQTIELNNQLNNTKIEYYLNYSNISIRSKLQDIIINTNSNIHKFYNQKYYFDYLTLEYYAQNIKNQYLITNMIFNLDGSKLFETDNLDSIDSVFLENILVEIHKNSLDANSIRKLARHELWKSFWNVSKETIFPGTIKDWTDEQRSIINFSKTLDSIREHMEAPSEDIINDDDALDGWILYQNDKIEKEKKKKQLEERYGLSDKNGDEVFIVSNDLAERRNILSLNTKQANKDIMDTISFVQGKKNVDWVELPHVQRDLKQKISELNKS